MKNIPVQRLYDIIQKSHCDCDDCQKTWKVLAEKVSCPLPSLDEMLKLSRDFGVFVDDHWNEFGKYEQAALKEMGNGISLLTMLLIKKQEL